MKPISSMTGFSNIRSQTSAGQLNIDIRSVNSRFLEIYVKMPDELKLFEGQVREIITQKCNRGKIEIRFSLGASDEKTKLTINENLLNELIDMAARIQNKSGASCLTVNEILNFPGMVSSGAPDEEIFKQEFFSALSSVLDTFSETRQREGASLGKILLGYCDQIDALVTQLEPKLPQILENLKQKLEQRLDEAFEETLSQKCQISKEEISDRIRQEVTLYGMKMDVQEEMTRLRTHVVEVRRTIEKGGPIGKRLDFFMQELNREANTLGSKAVAIEMTDTSVNLKLLIEAMREQIQNLE